MMNMPNKTGWAIFLLGSVIVIIDIIVIYFFSTTPTTPPLLTYALTGILGAIIGVSYLYTARVYLFNSAGQDTPVRGHTLGRMAEMIVSVTVLGPMTIAVGTTGGILLTLFARIGLFDPHIDEAVPLRTRLLTWSRRNRAFLSSRGAEELPLHLITN